MAHIEKNGNFFQIRRLQSALIFSILNHPCSCLVYYYLFELMFFYLNKLLFCGFLQFKGDFTLRKMT